MTVKRRGTDVKINQGSLIHHKDLEEQKKKTTEMDVTMAEYQGF